MPLIGIVNPGSILESSWNYSSPNGRKAKEGKLRGLEALGHANDVIAEEKDGVTLSVEVKYIGTEDWDFEDILDSVDRGGVGKGRARNIPSAADFLLLKIYEAAKQLEASSGRRTAVVIINDYLAWPIFDFVLSHQWIDWNSPRLTSTDAEWQPFLDEFKKRYPQVETDLPTVLSTLREIRIFRLTEGFVLSGEYTFPPNTTEKTGD